MQHKFQFLKIVIDYKNFNFFLLSEEETENFYIITIIFIFLFQKIIVNDAENNN